MSNIDQRLSDIENTLRKLMHDNGRRQQKSAAVRRLLSAVLNRIKPYILPFLFGIMVGVFFQHFISFTRQTSLEQRAASGGAAIPFASGSLLPSPSALPPGDSNTETIATSSKSSYELPLPVNRPADTGQTRSMRLSRPLARPIR